MIEIISVEQKEVTDQEATEAIGTIKRYCDGRLCPDCVIRKVCEEYFDNQNCERRWS